MKNKSNINYNYILGYFNKLSLFENWLMVVIILGLIFFMDNLAGIFFAIMFVPIFIHDILLKFFNYRK
jgi:hypothetical protein